MPNLGRITRYQSLSIRCSRHQPGVSVALPPDDAMIAHGVPCPRTCTMVQPRSAADSFVSGQVHDHDGISSQENALAGGGGPSSKKRRRDGGEVPKKRHRGEYGGLCRLNIDELYIVRQSPLYLDPSLTGSMIIIDFCIHLSYGPFESCTYVQVPPGPLDAQIVAFSMEDFSTSGRGIA